MTSAQINPMLIQLLTGKSMEDIPNFPTRSYLPGEYARLVYKQKEHIKSHFKENFLMIKCKTCGRKGKYDVGILIVNPDKNDFRDVSKSIQTTGYFRCKHCNDAGNWEAPHEFLMAPLMATIQSSHAESALEERVTIGKSRLHDGSEHLYASDGEMHLLELLREDPENSFIWNRLGNIYDKGNRQELAAAVCEHSIMIDPGQIESHFLLAGYFSQMGYVEKSAYHFKQMLIGASDYKVDYKTLPPKKLREMLAYCLVDLFYIHHHSNGKIPFLPTSEEFEDAGKVRGRNDVIVDLELDLFPDDPESFYPLAEVYMGKLRSKLPTKLRTFKIEKRPKKKKKKWGKRRK